MLEIPNDDLTDPVCRTLYGRVEVGVQYFYLQMPCLRQGHDDPASLITPTMRAVEVRQEHRHL